MAKLCSKCKNKGEFHKNSSKPDGLDHYCKLCRREMDTSAYKKRWRDKNTEYINQYSANYRVNNLRKYADLEAMRRARFHSNFVEFVDSLILLERDDGICGICCEDVDPFEYHIDHIIPLCKNGEHSYVNTQIAHPSCNISKGGN